MNKIVSLHQLEIACEVWREQGCKIIFTNGCFDILHAGHIHSLNESKKNPKDKLIVGLNSDTSVRRIKGESRPVQDEYNRAVVLSALEIVDAVIIFSSDTPEDIIRVVKPDIMTKGADWHGKEVAGAKFVESYGGKVLFINFLTNISTTNIINKIHGSDIF